RFCCLSSVLELRTLTCRGWDGLWALTGAVDGPEEKPHVAIDSHDIKGSELRPWPPSANADVRIISWETTEEMPEPSADQQDEEEQTTTDVEVPATEAADTADTSQLKRLASYHTAAWWWSSDKSELTAEEQAAVLAVVVTLLTVLGLLLAAVWQLTWFAWCAFRERRLLTRLFSEPSAEELEQELRKFPVDLLSLRIKQVASVRLRHLQVVADATDFQQQLEAVAFHEDTRELVNLPLHPTSRKDMTFAEMLSAVEEIACRGEQVAVEMMTLVAPPRWRHYVDQSAWLKVQDHSLQSLHAESMRVQQLSTVVSDLLMTALNSGEVFPKPVFLSLLASLRQNSGNPLPTTGSGGSTSEMDAFNRCWSGSMSMSGSVGTLGGHKSKDEFSFFLKAFDEVAEQQTVRQELQNAIENFQTAHEPEHEQLLLLGHTEGVGNSQVIRRTKQLSASAAASNSTTAASTRRLERFVDRAELMEMTHVEEVESAQFMLEDARRDNFCAAIVSNDGKNLDNVQALASNFVTLGAKREDAILKAGEILANRSNMMLLVNSLRGMFDELRKRDIMKMNERRSRDRTKALEKRERMTQKFHHKQQLITDKIERTREAQRQQEEEARLRRREEELKEWRAQRARDRAAFVWRVTKADVLLVLVVMAVVFFENLREVAFVKPLCQPDDEHHWWMVSWWAPSSLQVFGCEVAYGMKILAVLLLLGALFFVVAQLNAAAVLLPVLGAIGLYYLRAEWMNMLFRLPLLLVIYGFNSGVLYLLNRFEDRSSDAHKRKEKDKEQVSSATKRRNVLLYVAFPAFSLLLTLVTSVGIACDAPEHCAASAYATAVPVLAGLCQLVRGAYRV
ncbi:hypothetical protein BBJ28_00016578, partial [Nothophytophthora sp. Chile5]